MEISPKIPSDLNEYRWEKGTNLNYRLNGLGARPAFLLPALSRSSNLAHF